jgi:hypothetical protein
MEAGATCRQLALDADHLLERIVVLRGTRRSAPPALRGAGELPEQFESLTAHQKLSTKTAPVGLQVEAPGPILLTACSHSFGATVLVKDRARRQRLPKVRPARAE